MYSLFGIPNCDTVKKVKKYLDNKGVEYNFVNFKNNSPTNKDIKRWGDYLGELPVNKRGTTYRKIKDQFEAVSKAQQSKILTENSSAIKRPILEKSGKVISIGFDEKALQKSIKQEK